MKKKKKNPFEIVKYKMQAEGFDYCFRDYSEWKEIKDKEFHRIREEYVRIAQELEDYVDEKFPDDPEDSEDE